MPAQNRLPKYVVTLRGGRITTVRRTFAVGRRVTREIVYRPGRSGVSLTERKFGGDHVITVRQRVPIKRIRDGRLLMACFSSNADAELAWFLFPGAAIEYR